MKNSDNAYCKWVKTQTGKLLWRFISWLFVLASLSLAGCASTSHLGAKTLIQLEQKQVASLTPRLIDARPISEKIYRIGVKSDYPESVALGDENFNPDRLRVLDTRLQNALGAKLKGTDQVSVERFEVLEYVRDVKTPTASEAMGSYLSQGTAPLAALPIAIPIRQMMDRVITTVAEVELRVKINGKSFSSKMAAALSDVNREYGVSQAFELSFKYLAYDLETALQQ